MSNLILRIVARLEDARGQALAEYGLILGLIAIAAVIAMGLLGLALSDKFDEITHTVNLP